MSEQFIAHNALLVSTTRDKKGGSAKVKFALTQGVTEALDWPSMPDGTGEWCPEVDELVAATVEFTPNDEQLRGNAVSIDAQTIGDFVVVRKKKKAGKNAVKAEKVTTEVACIIKFTDPLGCAKLEQYLQSAKRSEMLVCYTPQPKQDDLPGTRVDMSPPDPNQESLFRGAVTPQAEQLPDDPEFREPDEPEALGPVLVPTHADRLAARRKESERKAALRKAAEPTEAGQVPETVQ